ncbi:MAG: heme ABC transporter ATP-binding protein CcmA, partial [Gammaproteobacteria bacterium TMED180]
MLRVKDLICFRGDRALFEAVSFSLNNGDILQVCGPNGSGKTTLMRTLVGLYKSYTGCFDWDLP